jgi:hypothetical protein
VQQIVGHPRQRHRDLGRQILHPRLGLGKHLDVDAGCVHLAQPQRAEIAQPLDRFRVDLIDRAPQGDELGRPEMLFECDDPRVHVVLSVRS